MNTPNPTHHLNQDGYPEKAIRAFKRVRVVKGNYVFKMNPAIKTNPPVNYRPRRDHILKSIVLLEKVNSFRRERGDLPGAPARLDL